MVTVADDPLLDLVAKSNRNCGKSHGHEAQGNQDQRNQALDPEAPFPARQLVRPAKALHQRIHHAHGGHQAHQDGGKNHLFGAHLLIGEVGVQQGHGVFREHLGKGGAHLPAQRIRFRGEGQQGSEHQDGGKETENSGVSGALGGAEYVMRERGQQGEADFFEPTTHAIEGT